MKFSARINVMPLPNLLDPQGKAVASNLKMQGFNTVQDVRIGKHILLELEANDAQEANEKVDYLCKYMLANAVMEHYSFEIQSI